MHIAGFDPLRAALAAAAALILALALALAPALPEITIGGSGGAGAAQEVESTSAFPSTPPNWVEDPLAPPRLLAR